MTLKGKNRYTLILSTFFLGLSIFFLVYFILKMNAESRMAIAGTNSEGFGQTAWAMIFSSLCLMAFVPAAAFFAYSHFVKTPSMEIVYFMLFLLGCSTGLVRLFVLFETTSGTFPEYYVFFGRTEFWGQLLCFASLFMVAVAGMPDQRVNVAHNIFIVLIFSITLAKFVPVNTLEFAQTFSLGHGAKRLLIFFCALAATLTAATHSLKAWQSESNEHYALAADTVIIETGLMLLSSSETLALAIIGATLLVAGTFRYLGVLHRLYM